MWSRVSHCNLSFYVFIIFGWHNNNWNSFISYSFNETCYSSSFLSHLLFISYFSLIQFTNKFCFILFFSRSSWSNCTKNMDTCTSKSCQRRVTWVGLCSTIMASSKLSMVQRRWRNWIYISCSCPIQFTYHNILKWNCCDKSCWCQSSRQMVVFS